MDKIMFIDDDAMVIRMAAFIMKKSGYQSVSAQSGEEGIAAAKAEHPVMIFVDAEMPVMNGFEVVKQLKADADTADIPVCMMSGTITDEIKDKAIKCGAIGMIEKPLKAPEIISIVNKL